MPARPGSGAPAHVGDPLTARTGVGRVQPRLSSFRGTAISGTAGRSLVTRPRCAVTTGGGSAARGGAASGHALVAAPVRRPRVRQNSTNDRENPARRRRVGTRLGPRDGDLVERLDSEPARPIPRSREALPRRGSAEGGVSQSTEVSVEQEREHRAAARRHRRSPGDGQVEDDVEEGQRDAIASPAAAARANSARRRLPSPARRAHRREERERRRRGRRPPERYRGDRAPE